MVTVQRSFSEVKNPFMTVNDRWLAVILRAATFIETRAPTSRKYAAEEDIVMSNWSKTF